MRAAVGPGYGATVTNKPDLLDEVPELEEAVDAVCEAAPSDARRR